MFDLVAKYKKWIMIGLFVLIIPPFALFGIDTYFREGRGGGQNVATVGDYDISEQEFSQALRDRQEQLRNMSGGRVDPALLESPEQRAAVLDNLIRQRVLIAHALRSGITVTPDQLRAYISAAPVFQENGQFSPERYQQFLKDRNYTAGTFEKQLRRDMMLTQLNEAYAATSFVPRTLAERLLRITEQQREVSRAVIAPDKFAGSVKLEEGAAKKYYDEQQSEFRVPEQVRVEYVTLSAETLPQAQVDPVEAKKFYEGNQRQFGIPETREASHILIAVDKTAGDGAKEKARALAEQIAGELKKNPARFAELAKKHSQDPGSAAKGGELGSFSRGSMVKAFDEAVFSLKAGEISAPVESEYGYHVIRVTGVTPAQMRSFEQARPEIEKELAKAVSGRAYAEMAEKLNNIAFEQSESLKPAADLLKQAPQKSGWLTRQRAEEPRLNTPKLLQAIFSDDVLTNKRNTEAVEVAAGTIVVARIAEHKPSAIQPFDQVKGGIEEKLARTRASQLAAQEGRQQLEQLRKGQDAQIQWGPAQSVSRADAKGLTEPQMRQVFKTDVTRLPAYTGVEAPGGGYMVLRISKVVEPNSVDRAQQKALGEGLAQMLGEEHFAAYMTSLKQKTKVRINKDQIERKQ